MRFNGICIITPDVPRLREFYCALLGVEAQVDQEAVTLATRGAELSLFTDRGMERLAPGSMAGAGRGSYTLEIGVADVDREYARVQRMQIPIVKLPVTYPWGRRSFWFRDPDGNIVNFYSPA
jgi:catechol 2,3-dioxygenase-like lactoylglutathione lyase family enzyme